MTCQKRGYVIPQIGYDKWKLFRSLTIYDQNINEYGVTIYREQAISSVLESHLPLQIKLVRTLINLAQKYIQIAINRYHVISQALFIMRQSTCTWKLLSERKSECCYYQTFFLDTFSCLLAIKDDILRNMVTDFKNIIFIVYKGRIP